LGLTFDASGNLYASGFKSNNVVEYDSNGALIGTFIAAGSGGLSGPSRSLFIGSAAVPEPSSLVLCGLGITCLLAARRVRRSSPAGGLVISDISAA